METRVRFLYPKISRPSYPQLACKELRSAYAGRSTFDLRTELSTSVNLFVSAIKNASKNNHKKIMHRYLNVISFKLLVYLIFIYTFLLILFQHNVFNLFYLKMPPTEINKLKQNSFYSKFN